MRHAAPLLMILGCICMQSACGKKSGEANASEGTGATAEGVRAQEASGTPAPAEPKAFTDHTQHYDLWEHAHLAEIDHHGLYIELGGPTRAKFTYGDWRSGWGSDGAAGADRFSHAVGDGSRVYFGLDKADAVTLRLRIKPVGTSVVTPYVNNTALASVKLSGTDFKDYDVAVPAEKLIAGENKLLLRFGGTTNVDGEARAAAVASIRVIRGAVPEGAFAPPRLSELRTELSVKGVQRRALAVRAPGALAYYLEVPKDAKLGFGAGVAGAAPKGAKARVVITPEGGAAKELWQADLSERWNDALVDLGAYAGKAVRLELKVDGDVGTGRAGFSRPVVLLPKQALAAPEKKAKNVVVVLIDTLRARSLKAFNPRSRVKTPVIDQLAKDGAVLDACQAPENWTKPSTASLLTGLYPATHGAKSDGAMLPKGATLLSESLKAAGFKTGSFIANGYVSDKFGFNQGWDHYTNYIREHKSTEAENVFKEAGDWVEKNKDKRFFAYVHTIDPHVPYDPPEQFLSLYKKGEYSGQVRPRKTPEQLADAKRNPPKVTFTPEDKQNLQDLYDGDVSYHDHYMGLFIERLKKLGLYDDTVFVVTADHGEEFDEHGSWGHGHSVYQELLWIPYVVRLPGVVPAGARLKQATSSMTIFPTVLEAAGVALPSTLEEQSVLGWVRGGPPPVMPVAFSDFLDDRRVIRAGRWKLILRGLNETFFDLESDPTEQKELDRSKHPIAARYATLTLGQFLGARDRRSWLKGAQGPGTKLERQNADIDPTLREQLKAIGYAGDGPTADTH
ncbi:MAG: sulfatase [Polyangiales bacterium]